MLQNKYLALAQSFYFISQEKAPTYKGYQGAWNLSKIVKKWQCNRPLCRTLLILYYRGSTLFSAAFTSSVKKLEFKYKEKLVRNK